MSDRISDPWGERTPLARGGSWPARIDSRLAPGLDEHEVERWVPAASVLHSNGDAMDLAVRRGRLVGVRGRPDDRVNRGRLDPKDLVAWQANAAGDRLTAPLVRHGGELRPAGWDAAMGRVVERSRSLLAERGPASIAFYTSGQLFLEEYYTLATIARAGIATSHIDANTRLCTATAAEALKQSFGCDGQPGSYADVDHCDALFLVGHNVAETQTVLWMRMLDRLHGPDRPRLVVVDPRTTAVAREADVHLPIRVGTNLALLNALVRELIENGWIDEDYLARHAVGFEELRERTAGSTPEWAAEICRVPADGIRAAARILGTADSLVSTVLQGVYQSPQATASACQVNNLHILRGMLGRPGAGVLQMNGQPSSQNTRECGATGDPPGFRNWQNDAHVADLARVWNVRPSDAALDAPSTPAMEILRLCEEGSIGMLWISCTNPAVSMPDLARIRSILAQERLFVVVQDPFLTETARLADVVLPSAMWGEKTGTMTNTDRTVHLCERAVDPPGGARGDLDIFLDYARRMDFRDRDGDPLVSWEDPESTFEAWKRCARGRPCDYAGVTYARLREEGGIQWPCRDEEDGGTERLYADGRFWARPEECEDFGKELASGAPYGEADYRASNPEGRAMLRSAAYEPPDEAPSPEFPLMLTSGRTLVHFHTRTRTGRVPELERAEPEVWVRLAHADAERLGIADGDPVDVVSPRGRLRAPARLGGVRPGVVFMPFHYGYWDRDADGSAGRPRAANELTPTVCDPVSQQPHFKAAAVRVEAVAGASVEAGAQRP